MRIHRAGRPRGWLPAQAARAATQVARVVLAAAALAAGATPGYAQTVPLVGDAHTDSTNPTTRNGSAPTLRVSPDGAVFVRFDLSAVPAGMTVEQATLVVRPLRVLASGVLAAHAVTATWQEDTLTHERRPSWRDAPIALQNINEQSAGGGDLTFSVTTAVAAWLDGAANDGLALVGDGVVDIDFASKENQTAPHPPRLELVLVPAAARAP